AHARVAGGVPEGRLTYTQGVRDGMYRPLGSGDVDVPAIVGSLHGRGYDGWGGLGEDTIPPGGPAGAGPAGSRRGGGYAGWCVLEQDTILTAEPAGEGPLADVWASAEHLRGVLA